MSIHSVLRHRATVKRGAKDQATGETTWQTLAVDVPCLLTDQRAQDEQPDSQTQRPADRVGLLLASPTADLRPGDRLVFTRGPSGTYLLRPEGLTVHTPSGAHHVEFAVERV